VKKIGGRRRTKALAAIWLALTIGLAGCSSEPAQEKTEAAGQEAVRHFPEVPVVTLQHWRDSTPGERYAFLIGFVTMLELEKEWQGRDGRALKPFDESLVGDWVTGLAHRPLTEMYHALNQPVAGHPGDLHRPAAEVMWFLFVRPRQAEPTENAGPRP
jgi:hypothetical protein